MKQLAVRTIAVCLLISGCASYKPQLKQEDLSIARQPSASETKDGVTVSVEEFATPDKSRKAFDADTAHYGVLAVLIRLENKGAQNYQIRRSNVTAFIADKQLSQLLADDAASKSAKSEYVGKALAWTLATGPLGMILWPGTIAGSASHTAYVNRRVKWHFQGMELKDAELKPNETVAGFVYFEMPGKSKKLEGLVLQVDTASNGGEKVAYNLTVPSVDLE
jgi:hypothetical protein